ncbi:MAG: hypothetical protein HKN32_08365, partial [Flavobacteriales bacterium]|nr:hypothetical protein [Flavobacteriales bacterium]
MATPVRLNPDTTFINLEDYIVDIERVDSVVVDGNKQLVEKSSAGFFFSDQLTQPIGNMRIFCGGFAYDVPVIKSVKELYTFEYEASPSVEDVQITGNINGWNPAAGTLNRVDDVWTTQMWLTPGLYQYQVVEDGEWKLDKNHNNTISNGRGGLNSTFIVGNP